MPSKKKKKQKADRGTPETRSKLRRDPILDLVRAKKLDLTHLTAVEQIERGFHLASGGLGLVKVHVMERLGRTYTTDAGTVNQIVTERKYRRWADKADDLPQLLAMIVERESPHKVDRRFHVRNGTSLKILKKGLDLYLGIR